MFTWLPFITLLAPTGRFSIPRDTQPLPAYTAVGSGITVDSSPMLLTVAGVSAYATVRKALATYWAEHPAQEQTNLTAHSHDHTLVPNTDPSKSISAGLSISILDYTSIVVHDTAVAGIFREHHFVPAQFAPTQDAVDRAIVTILLAKGKDTLAPTTVAGRNVALVRQHQQELAEDWGQMTSGVRLVTGMNEQIGTAVQHIMTNTRLQSVSP